MTEYVPLREHLEALQAERQRALELRTAELSRRLEELNHAHQKAVDDRAMFATREMVEALSARFDEYKSVTQEALAIAAGAKQGSVDTRSIVLGLVAAGGVVAGVIGLLV